MAQSEVQSLAIELKEVALQSVRKGVPLTIAACANPESLCHYQFEELKSLILKEVPGASLIYRTS